MNMMGNMIEFCKEVHRIAKLLGQRALEGSACNDLGTAYQNLRDFQRAIEYHTQALSIAKEVGDKAGESAAYGSLGNDYLLLSDFKQAIENHTQSLSIARELGDRIRERQAYCNLGNVYQNLGDFKQAIKYHQQQLHIAREMGDRAGEGRAYGNLGNDYRHLDDFKQSIEYHLQRLNIAKELGDKAGEGRAYCNLGNVYQGLNDFKHAIKYHKKDLKISKELGDRAGEGAACGCLGNDYHCLGNFQQAINYHTQCLSIAKEVGDRVAEGRAYYFLGCDFDFSDASDAFDKAVYYYRASVKQLNDVRALLKSEDEFKITFRNESHRAYLALWRTLVKLGKTDEALCVAEQGRAQALLDLMKSQYDTELLVSGTFEAKQTIPEIFTVTSTQSVFVALEKNKIHLWVLCKGVNVPCRRSEIEEDAAGFLECLRQDVLKEYLVSSRVKCENRSLDELRKKLPSSEQFEQETVKAPHCDNNSLRLLHDCIIGPIADLLQGDELVIVPDGPLCLAPFAAFLDSESRYLSESVRIRIAPSLTSLKLIADSGEDYHRTSGVLLVGDPYVEEVRNERGNPILSPLPYARKEVMMIGGMLGIKPLIGKKATREEVLRRIGSVALVHIAAHGDMKSGEIALAPNPARKSKVPEEKDFMLKMADVKAAQLRARLVVLSCCHSAQGTVSPEGVVGIARAFLGAGARSVLVSLWAIDDEATMEFMKSFYQHLRLGYKATVALNWAMKCLRESEKFGAVKYWAPFVLIGDDVTI